MSHRSIVLKHSADIRPSIAENDAAFITARDRPTHSDYAVTAARLYIHTQLDFGQYGEEIPSIICGWIPMPLLRARFLCIALV